MKEEEKTEDKVEEEEKKEEEDESKVDEAARRIQAVFRGHNVRKNIMKDTDSSAKTDSEPTREELEAEFRADDEGLFYCWS